MRDITGRRISTATLCFALSMLGAMPTSQADEGGVSMWLPGSFASLAATPLVPGLIVSSTFYQTSISAGAGVGFARGGLDCT